MKKKINLGNSKQSLDINFDDISLVPQLIGVNNKNLREIEDIIDVEIDSNGTVINLYGKRRDCALAKNIIENNLPEIIIEVREENKLLIREFLIKFGYKFFSMLGKLKETNLIDLKINVSTNIFASVKK